MGSHELYSASLGAFYHRPTSYLANHVANKLDHFFCRQRARRHPDAPLMQIDPADYKVEPSDPWHPNAKGHELIADVVFQSLEPLVLGPGVAHEADAEPSIQPIGDP